MVSLAKMLIACIAWQQANRPGVWDFFLIQYFAKPLALITAGLGLLACTRLWELAFTLMYSI